MLVSLIFGAVAGVFSSSVQGTLTDTVTKYTPIKVGAAKQAVLSLILVLLAAAILAGLVADAEGIWLLVGALLGSFWQEIRDAVTKR